MINSITLDVKVSQTDICWKLDHIVNLVAAKCFVITLADPALPSWFAFRLRFLRRDLTTLPALYLGQLPLRSTAKHSALVVIQLTGHVAHPLRSIYPT